MCKKLIFLSIATLVLGPALANAASLGPVGWWKFDETSGTTAADSAGSHNGTLLPANANPMAAWVPGKIGGALQFGRAAGAAANAATNPYVDLGIGDLLGKLGDSTFALWVNWGGSTNGDWQRILDFGAGTTVYAFLAANQAGTNPPRFAIRNIATGEQIVTAPTGTALTGTWHHIAVGINRTTMRNWLYVDGVAVANAATILLPQDMVPPAGQAWQTWVARSQYPADAYFVGMVDDLRIYDRFLSADDVTNMMNGGGGFGVANTATPATNATNVLRDQILSWTAGTNAVSHNVYFGTSAASLTKVGSAQTATTFNPGRMQFNTKYYWRVDEVQADGSVITGNLWSFTTELLATKITSVTATASSFIAGSEPTKTTDNSGIDANDLADTNSKNMWQNDPKVAGPVWIQYTFDRIYKLYEMWVWNYNSEFESLLGYGFQNVTVEYSVDGVTWAKMGDVVFNQGISAEGYAHNTTISFNGIAAKAIKLTPKDNFGGMPTYGLSEVRFYYTPAFATTPSPATAATGQRPDVTLTWRPGRGVATHNIYLGTDPNNLVLVGTTTTPSYTPTGLQLGNFVAGVIYYWRVDEVNNAEVTPVMSSSTWSFTTASFLVVDDMESYTNDMGIGKAIFQTWIDGYGTRPTTNGSQVGYVTAPFAERTIAHGGVQSMPFFYTNSSSTAISEATRTFATPQDWTIGGITTLTVFVKPTAASTGAKPYVKINNTKVTYPSSLVTSPSPLWTQWNVDLTALTGLNAVNSMTFGVSGTGTGLLYVDDIRLYRTAMDTTPKDPCAANLVSYFDMEGGQVFDAISNTTGNLNGCTFTNSLVGSYGQALQCTGGGTTQTTQFVDLGANYWTNVVSKLSSSTFAVWVNYSGQGGVWPRVFDFGSGSNVNTWITTSAGTAGIARFAVKTNVPNAGSTGTGYVETNVSAPKALTVGWHHLVGVVDATGGALGNPILFLYVDGAVAGGPSAGRLPKDMVIQTPTPWQMWLGKSQYFPSDPFFNGAMDELRVYNRALTAGEIYYLAGGR